MINNPIETLQDFSPVGEPESTHDEILNLDGLEHVFRWASEVVADGEDGRVKLAREKRVSRQVLDVVQKYKEHRIASQSAEELAYLQRRVIALLQKLQEMTEENSVLKQIMVTQYYQLQNVPDMEREVKRLKSIEFEREAAVNERRHLMDALSQLKRERDHLEQLVDTNEGEVSRVGKLLADTKQELARIQSRKWWHFFVPAKG